MKRYFNIILSVILILAFASCGKKKIPEGTEKDLFVIGFSQVGSESDWRLANTESMVQTFKNENGYELIVENAKQQQDNQLSAIRNFILEDVDLIIIAPTIEEGWDTVLNEVHDAGIPVIIIDRSVNVWNKDLFLTNIGSDFFEQGSRAISWLEENDDSSPGNRLKILHLQGTLGATAQIQITKALEDAMKEHPNWTMVSQLYGDFTEAKAYEVMTEYLKKSRDIDVIYSENDNMTFGAMRALDEAGITYGEGGQVKIITFDATKKALQYCLDGKINLCVECNPMHGPYVLDLIEKYRAGEAIPKQVYVEESVFTKDDLTQDFINSRGY